MFAGNIFSQFDGLVEVDVLTVKCLEKGNCMKYLKWGEMKYLDWETKIRKEGCMSGKGVDGIKSRAEAPPTNYAIDVNLIMKRLPKEKNQHLVRKNLTLMNFTSREHLISLIFW